MFSKFIKPPVSPCLFMMRRKHNHVQMKTRKNLIGNWIISQSWDEKNDNLFSQIFGCFHFQTTFNTKAWDVSWQLQELISLMFPLISSSCSKWRCGSGCDCSMVSCEIFSISTSADFFFFFFFFFQRLEDWISRDPFLMIWRQRLSFRKDEMNTEGGLCWQCLNGCFLPPSRPVFCARFSAAPPPPTTSTIHPLSLLFFSCFIVIPSGLLQHPSWPKSTR